MESECRFEADIRRAVDARGEAIGVDIAPRCVKPPPKPEKLSSMDHPGDLPALVARIAQPLLHPKRVNNRLNLMVAYVHVKHYSCIHYNYQAEKSGRHEHGACLLTRQSFLVAVLFHRFPGSLRQVTAPGWGFPDDAP